MIQVRAPAKLNLSLDVLGKRPDGYHEMCMVMQSFDLCDTLQLRENGTHETRVSSNLTYLPTGERNLISKAAVCFYRALGRKCVGYDVTLDKCIPVCAGMGGGSSDAGAMLRVLNQQEQFPFSVDELVTLAEQIGADVPYCVLGKTALALGKGELVRALPPLPSCWVVACKPTFSISTPELFASLGDCKIKCHPDTDGLLAALQQGDLGGVARRMYNVFEQVLPPRQHAHISALKSVLIEHGALGASMSGTGPTVFALFAHEQQARAAASVLEEWGGEVFSAPSV